MRGKHTLLGLSLLGFSLAASADMNCQQTFADPTQITPETLTEWAKFAAHAAYDFDYQNQNEKFESLKGCFTEAGWKSFQDAMTQSNNLEVINKEKLKVSANIENEVSVTPVPGNAWKIQVPLKVRYENTTRHVNQTLTADLLIEMHNNHDGQLQLGIAQFITKPAVNPG